MPTPIVSPAFVRLMDKRIRMVEENKYKSLPSMIPQLYNIMTSDSAWEEFYSVGSVPDVPEWTGSIPYLSIAPGYHFRVEPKRYSAGLQFDRTFLEDKKYDVLNDSASGLVESAHRTKEKLGVRAFAYAFSTAFDFMQSEEGIALCGSHLTKSGTSTASGFSNSGTSALNKTSLAATRLLMRKFRNDISERIEMSDNLAIIVPDALADSAYEIVGTEKGLDALEGNKNMNYQRFKVIPYLRLDDYDANNWFMVDLAQMKRDLIWLERWPIETKHTVDFDTYLTKLAVYFRCGYGWKDWRFIYGHNVT